MSINRLKKKILRTYERHTCSEKGTVARLCACAFPASRTGYSSPRIWGLWWFARPVVPLAGKFPPLGASFEPPWHTVSWESETREVWWPGWCEERGQNSTEMKLDLFRGVVEALKVTVTNISAGKLPAIWLLPPVYSGAPFVLDFCWNLLSALVCPACDQMGSLRSSAEEPRQQTHVKGEIP